MRTKAAALNTFWSSFGMMAYEENSVPTGSSSPDFPYITYQVSTDSFGGKIALTGSVWDRDKSGYSATVNNNRVAEEISKKLGRSGTMISCDGGALWLSPGQPFSQSLADPTDDKIHRKLINIVGEYLTNY